MSDQQYDNTNRGVLFKNDRREKDTHPEYNGTINVGGVDYWLSAWVKDGRKGKFFSLSVKAKEAPRDEDQRTVDRTVETAQRHFPGATVHERERPNGIPQRPAPSNVDLNDDIPF